MYLEKLKRKEQVIPKYACTLICNKVLTGYSIASSLGRWGEELQMAPWGHPQRAPCLCNSLLVPLHQPLKYQQHSKQHQFRGT